jgi:predicted Zn-dependent protease with MMP-like domain
MTAEPSFTTAPTCADIDALARRSCEDLPKALAGYIAGVVIQVQEFPDEDVERDMKLESPFDLLGLYQGVALTEKSVHHVVEQPDMIFLYRRPLLDYWCEGGEDLTDLIRHVIIHEIGHHFGFSDDDMDRIEDAE